ncbi:hypothetical protein FRB98_001539 [Tulasnella sp. 332]|nr:hypothetical protein FRB98_001539 [Tulasnella sp. 332]
MSGLIGEIRERNPSTTPTIKPQGKFDPNTGFPAVHHRSKSAFAKGRDATRAVTTKDKAVPIVRTPSLADPPDVPDTALSLSGTTAHDSLADTAWRKGMEEQNEARIREMSEAEREQETAELAETFGPGLLELVRKAKRRRVGASEAAVNSDSKPEVAASDHLVNDKASTAVYDCTLPTHDRARELDLQLHTSGLHSPFHGSRPSSPLPSALRPSTPNKSATSRKKIHFSAAPAEVHVYESAPTSPKRQPIGLLGPPDPDRPSDNQLTYDAGAFLKRSDIRGSDEEAGEVGNGRGDVKGGAGGQENFIEVSLSEDADKTETGRKLEEEDDEGTPEYIRKRYFPTAAVNDPTLQWIKATPPKPYPVSKSDPTSSITDPASLIRYDLAGQPIAPSLQTSLPTHLGLHHHGGDQDQAGYTIEDLLLLSRSTVPAQRASMLGVLGKVLLSMESCVKGREDDDLRSKVLAAGLDAMMERGSVGIMAVEVLWVALVQHRNGRVDAGGMVEDDPLDIATLVPPSILLGRIATLLHPTTRALPSESMTQLLDVLLHLVSRTSQCREAATDILRTTGLIQGIMMTFLTPSSTSSAASDPNPQAIILLNHIVQVSRANAKQIVDDGIADACLRFVLAVQEEPIHERPRDTAHQTASPLSRSLLTESLRLFISLGRYGLYTNIATDIPRGLSDYALAVGDADSDLSQAYLGLFEVWITCAVDPHRTTPTHDILWSQVVGWAWIEEILKFRRKLLERSTLTAVLNVLGAWIEGCSVNSVRAGQAEKAELVKELTDCESNVTSKERAILLRAIQKMMERLTDMDGLEQPQSLIELSEEAPLLQAAIRLAHALQDQHTPTNVSPFSLILDELPSLCQAIIASAPLQAHLVSSISSIHKHAIVRPITSLLATSIKLLEQRMPPEEWIPLATHSATHLIPGDENLASSIFSLLSKNLVKPLVVEKWGWSDVPSEVWSKGGFQVVLPFLANAIRRRELLEGGTEGEEAPMEVVAPYTATPKSIEEASTLVVPALQSKTVSRSNDKPGLPFASDWPFTALNDLLHSGTSAVFRTLPRDWDHSEVDIVRGTLLWASVAQHVSTRRPESRPTHPLMNREEVVFGCMKVFMLEHGQSSATSAGNDSASEVFRDDFISKSMDKLLFPFRIGQSVTSKYLPKPSPSLEVMALPFLGMSTPFFQFYSDFLSLYDSVSFGHPTFGSLLLPPLASNYAGDYRKLLWGDYPQVLRLLDFEVNDVIGDDTRRWLWPVEVDGEMIGMYLKALGRGLPRGFLRWLAVHHVACNIWPDLGNTDETIEGRRKKLLNAALSSTSLDVAKEIILYRQLSPESGTSVPPPQCFEQPGGWKANRLEWAVSWGGTSMGDRLAGLLTASSV